jgi:hypothetical protein
MPEISRFYGIKIYFFFRDHNPPHFHASYGDDEALISINSLEIIEGSLPKRALLLVVEWALLHRKELMQAWEIAVKGEVPAKIKPLR